MKLLFAATSDSGLNRITLQLSDADMARFHALPPDPSESIVVRDELTGASWKVRRGPCGLECFCGADAVPA